MFVPNFAQTTVERYVSSLFFWVWIMTFFIVLTVKIQLKISALWLLSICLISLLSERPVKSFLLDFNQHPPYWSLLLFQLIGTSNLELKPGVLYYIYLLSCWNSYSLNILLAGPGDGILLYPNVFLSDVVCLGLVPLSVVCHCTVVNCPTWWSLLLILGFLFWSSIYFYISNPR